MENIKNLSPSELVKIAETWQEEKETRSVVVVAIDRDDNEDIADITDLVSGNKRDMVIALADLIYREHDLFRLANKLAEVMKEKGEDLEGLMNGED